MSESCASRSTIFPLPSSPHCAPTMTVAGTSLQSSRSSGCREIRELRVPLQERELHRVGRTVAVLRENHLGWAVVLGLLVVVLIAIDERDEIRVLLGQVSPPAPIGRQCLVGSLLDRTRELRQRD